MEGVPTSHMLDPLLFAYKNDRGTEDAEPTMFNAVIKQLMHLKMIWQGPVCGF